jgi:hypothetical protein
MNEKLDTKNESKLNSIISKLELLNKHQIDLILDISQSLSRAIPFIYGEVKEGPSAIKNPDGHIEAIFRELKVLEENNDKLEKIKDGMRELS